MNKTRLVLSWLSHWLPPIIIIMIIFWFSSMSGNEMTILNSQFERVSAQIISSGILKNRNQAPEATLANAISTTVKTSQTPKSTTLPATATEEKLKTSGLQLPTWLSPFIQYFNWLKLGHIFWYACLGLVFRRAFLYKLDPNRATIAAILACEIYACMDEFHQGFVPGRDPLLIDICLDTASAAMVLKVQSWLFGKHPGTREVSEG